MLKVRYATAQQSDYEAFMKLHEHFRYAQENPKDEIEREVLVESYELYEVDAENTFFAVLEDEVVGYAIMSVSEREPNTCNIEEIYIRADLQRKGYGRSFVKEIVRVAKDEEFKRITLISANSTTDKIWLLMGFRPLSITSSTYELNIR